jgi:RNA polymerase sigma factor (sigma-70 family)
MASTSNRPAVRLLRQLAVAHLATDLTDPELLERFAVHRDDTAFAALVRRHGPLVLGVGRRVLGEAHAAEDVFQATFLVLARRAGSLRHPERLGPWLYGVALRTARKARAMAARRREGQRLPAAADCADPAADLVLRELRSTLDDALARLPEKYRVPVVLCYLEGRTVSEASRELGWPRGTVATRLTRGREHLRRGLLRRGLALSAAVTGGLSPRVVSAAVPVRLSLSTVHAAVLFAAGKTAVEVVPARVAALAQGGWNAMIWTKARLMLLAALVAGTLVSGVGAGLYRVMADEPKPSPATTPETAPASPGPGTPVDRPEETERLPIPAPMPAARERVIETQFRFFAGDPNGSLEAGTQQMMAMPRVRTPENQRCSACAGKEIPWGDAGKKVPTLFEGVKVECTATFGKERGTVLLDLSLAIGYSARESATRVEHQTVTKHVRDTVRLGKAVKYPLGRDALDRSVWVELVVWEAKEVLVGDDADSSEVHEAPKTLSSPRPVPGP